MPSRLLDRWFSPAPLASGRLDWLTARDYAHRGVHDGREPENSLAAFAAAIERGLGIEFDIQLSADGRAMVFHDFDLGRMTTEEGPVAERTSSELAAMSLAGTQETIPTLHDMLALVAGRVPLLIEIKSRQAMPVDRICRAVAEDLAGYGGHHAVLSFDAMVCRWFADNLPDVPRGLTFTEKGRRSVLDDLGRYRDMKRAAPHFLTYDVRDLPSPFAAAQRARGFPLVSWTIKDDAAAQRASACSDAMICESGGLRNSRGVR